MLYWLNPRLCGTFVLNGPMRWGSPLLRWDLFPRVRPQIPVPWPAPQSPDLVESSISVGPLLPYLLAFFYPIFSIWGHLENFHIHRHWCKAEHSLTTSAFSLIRNRKGGVCVSWFCFPQWGLIWTKHLYIPQACAAGWGWVLGEWLWNLCLLQRRNTRSGPRWGTSYSKAGVLPKGESDEIGTHWEQWVWGRTLGRTEVRVILCHTFNHTVGRGSGTWFVRQPFPEPRDSVAAEHLCSFFVRLRLMISGRNTFQNPWLESAGREGEEVVTGPSYTTDRLSGI